MHPFGLIVLGAIALIGFIWFRNQNAQQKPMALAKLILILLVLALVYLSISGRFHILGALVALSLPFLSKMAPLLLKLLPFLSLWYRNRHRTTPSGNTGANRSRVSSSILEMTLDHDTGNMQGRVLAGPMQGRELDELSETDFIELLRYCRQQDHDSARLLETYLDKRFGDSWRQDDPGGEEGDDQHGSADSDQMSREEALDILGLHPGATRDDIIQAHRRLIQKVHPDRGGSTYLATRINAAKKILLGK